MARSTEPQAGSARLLSLSGVAAVALVLVAMIGLDENSPGSEDPGSKIGAYYVAHEVREMIASFVLAASAPLFVLFAVTLAARLWQADSPRRSIWQSTLALGGAAAAIGFLVAATIHVALTQTANADNGAADGALQALAGLDESSWMAFNSGMGILMLGAAGSLLTAKAYPVPAWIALVLGIACFLPFVDFLALLVSGIWIIAMSIVMYRRAPAAELARSTGSRTLSEPAI
jgi:hypothetical protein